MDVECSENAVDKWEEAHEGCVVVGMKNVPHNLGISTLGSHWWHYLGKVR